MVSAQGESSNAGFENPNNLCEVLRVLLTEMLKQTLIGRR